MFSFSLPTSIAVTKTAAPRPISAPKMALTARRLTHHLRQATAFDRHDAVGVRAENHAIADGAGGAAAKRSTISSAMGSFPWRLA
jgi:hypothetical protein